ncbi:MAG TPA: hypothetical protein PLV68_18060, partial [Ilumatobacteraceae bacterium]|nr:hypothetical protein [Ilumatobacteraceae bacterium]
LLVQYFVEDSLEASMREVRGASLIGFSLTDYPDPLTDDGTTLTETVRIAIDGWIAGIERRVGHHAIADFHIDVFCLPVPSVAAFRDALRSELTRS